MSWKTITGKITNKKFREIYKKAAEEEVLTFISRKPQPTFGCCVDDRSEAEYKRDNYLNALAMQAYSHYSDRIIRRHINTSLEVQEVIKSFKKKKLLEKENKTVSIKKKFLVSVKNLYKDLYKSCKRLETLNKEKDPGEMGFSKLILQDLESLIKKGKKTCDL